LPGTALNEVNELRKWMKCIAALLCCMLLLAALSACGQKEEEVSTTPSVTTTPSPSPEPEPEPEPGPVNPLTGLPIQEELLTQRPVAVMINNIKRAVPQVGISKADIIYECTVEGGITRMMAVTTDYASLPVIGSVRSSRDYFIDFAQNHDALYVHAGGSPDAYSAIKSRNIDNMDGVNQNIPDMFYRDATRKKQMGYEHSLMTSGERIVAGIAYRGLRTEIKEGFTGPFQFVQEPYTPDGISAVSAYVPYSTVVQATFDYDEATQTYLKSEYGGPHIDGETGEQLAFTNVLILRAQHSNAKDDKGRIDVTFTGTGSGYYLTHGKAVEIQWSKADRDAVMQLTTTDGKPLEMNPGKSYISVVPTTAEVTLE
jgi:hypothetical protein